MNLGGVAYGQTRDVVVELPAGSDLSKVRVDVSSPPGPARPTNDQQVSVDQLRNL